VKLLFDQNLPPRLAQSLADIYPDSAHVRDLQMDKAPDHIIWETAQRRDFVIVTRDSDFAEKCLLPGTPAKVVLIRIGNCTTNELETILRCRLDALKNFDANNEAQVLVLNRESD